MAAQYRNVIVNAIKEYDNNALSEEEYEALAWEDIRNYSDFWGDLSQSERNAVGKITKMQKPN